MRKYVFVMSTLYVAALLVCCILPASAALVTDGLVGYYTVDALTGSTVATWANTATGPGAWGSVAIAGGATSANVVSTQTPVAGKAAVDLTAGNSLFYTYLGGWGNHDIYNSYSGMTILTVLKITDTNFAGGIAGPMEDNSICMFSNTDKTQMMIDGGAEVAGLSNPVVGKWTILASDMTNNTSGSNTVANLYQTDYTTGAPTTSSWTAAASAGSGTFHIYGGAGYDQFAFGGGLYWFGATHLYSKSEIAAVLVYNKVLTAEERAATTDSLYANFFTTGSDVPEPGSFLALACGLASFAGIAIRRRR